MSSIVSYVGASIKIVICWITITHLSAKHRVNTYISQIRVTWHIDNW